MVQTTALFLSTATMVLTIAPAAALHSASLLVITWILIIGAVVKWQQWKRQYSSSLPPLVKYSIPWVGSALEYRRSPPNFFRACRRMYGPVYRIYLGGRYMVVVSSPMGVDNVLWRPQNLDVFQFQMTHRIAGISDRRAAHIHEVAKPLLDVATRELAKRHLAAPAMTFGFDLLDRLRLLSESSCRVHQLSKFVQNNMYRSLSITLWGPLLPIDAETVRHFLTMDDGMVGILSGMPWSSMAARKSRTRLVRRFKEYVRLAWREEDQTLDGASTLMSRTVALSKDAVDEDELARLLLAIHWGSLSNLMNTAFWLWSYLLVDTSAFLRVKDEINAAIANKFGDVEALLRADPSACDDPCFATLNSAIRETLRMILLPTSIRQAVKDTSLLIEGGREYGLLKGDLIVLDVWNLHKDDETWAESHTFKVDRFIEKENSESQRGQKSSRSKEFVPFGGGQHICRGREFGLHALRTMLVVAISLFDISLVQEPGTLPKVPDFNLMELGSTIRPLTDLEITLIPINK